MNKQVLTFVLHFLATPRHQPFYLATCCSIFKQRLTSLRILEPRLSTFKLFFSLSFSLSLPPSYIKQVFLSISSSLPLKRSLSFSLCVPKQVQHFTVTRLLKSWGAKIRALRPSLPISFFALARFAFKSGKNF
jgi:hypothetical protein